ncbi:MAG: Clp1/GlmU family protein, partial [Dehalococcoidia bacterium]
MASIHMLPELEHSVSVILDTALAHDRRVLLWGDVGVGKSTLAASLARVLWQAGHRAWCIDADPGMPSFGIPGAVCRGEWWGEGWRALDLEALCSLDAGRFRLPLVAAVRRLAENQAPGTLLVDAPGVVRGVAGAELLTGLVEAARIDLIFVFARSRPPPLLAELKAAGIETFLVQVSPTTCRPNKRQRARGRTSLGIFGDPLLHIRLRQQRRSLLFDLGEGSRLPAHIAHQVSDVFISHAHIDHIGGFLWLLRSRMGDLPACRVFGPPGLSENIAGLLNGILWDRIGESGPRFEVTEFHDGRLLRFALQAGRHGIERSAEQASAGGLLVDEAALTVRAVTLDHGTPVLAFAFEQPRQFHIRKERLAARSLA